MINYLSFLWCAGAKVHLLLALALEQPHYRAQRLAAPLLKSLKSRPTRKSLCRYYRRADRTTTGRGIIVAASSPALRESHTNSWGGRRRPRSPSWGCPPLSSHRSPPARGTPRTRRPSSGAQGCTFDTCLGQPRRRARRRDQGGGLGGPDEARAARLGAARRPSLARAAHHARARPSPRPSGRRRRRGVTSAPPEHLPGGQRLRSGAGGPCEPAGTASAYWKARASPLSPARRVSLTTPPPPGPGVHRAYKMAAEPSPSDAVSSA